MVVGLEWLDILLTGRQMNRPTETHLHDQLPFMAKGNNKIVNFAVVKRAKLETMLCQQNTTVHMKEKGKRR